MTLTLALSLLALAISIASLTIAIDTRRRFGVFKPKRTGHPAQPRLSPPDSPRQKRETGESDEARQIRNFIADATPLDIDANEIFRGIASRAADERPAAGWADR